MKFLSKLSTLFAALTVALCALFWTLELPGRPIVPAAPVLVSAPAFYAHDGPNHGVRRMHALCLPRGPPASAFAAAPDFKRV